MFDKEKFSNILNNIVSNYENISDFASISKVGRSYISKYINKRIDAPPSPKVLKKIADFSKGVTNYDELMEICGHINLTNIYMEPIDKKIDCIPLLYNFDFSENNLYSNDYIIDYIPFITNDNINNYFAYQAQDDSMSPLLCKGDIAIIKKINIYEDGNTCLISLDNHEIIIRKIKDKDVYIELHTIIPIEDIRIILKSDFEKRNFKILGKVIKVENESAFK